MTIAPRIRTRTGQRPLQHQRQAEGPIGYERHLSAEAMDTLAASILAPEDRNDQADQEIDRARLEGRRPDPAAAFPDPAPDRSRSTDRMAGDNGGAEPDRRVTTAQDRIEEVFNDNPAYRQEYTLKLIHRMLLRNMPLDLIAESVSMSVTEVMRLRTVLFKRIRAEASNIDMLTHAGKSMAFYDEVRGMAMRMASDSGKQFASRVKAMTVALQAESDRHRFLQVSGFYDSVKFNPQIGDDDIHSKDANSLVSIAKSILDPTHFDINEDELDIAGLADMQDERSDAMRLLF